MKRSQTSEYMDTPGVPDQVVLRFYDDLSRLNRLLGNTQHLLEMLANEPPATLLDIGCGQGALLTEVYIQLGILGLGIDLRPSLTGAPILQADATKDRLPNCDLALCVFVAHHLEPEAVTALVRNVGRYAKRFYILDLVRHPVPLALFHLMRPLTSQLVFQDGVASIRRAYTPEEMRGLVVQGLAGTDAIFRQWVSPICAKQVIDIRYTTTAV